ncbi:origin recognition complex subunit 2-like [Mizuhopecten yessoensis]|uniref:Origin recognition complex subunit 2 n=1 Tax=Mizuhopecten yessoensis TaxID=6573 RepID=A0A210QDX7_MIZYE|nr:origin recognition complex subunit 2-like [Mizuhopecten yessoensis]OWF46942.1 Origin recognition complex subunit 2 [Mizuhopecten yessoensis]
MATGRPRRKCVSVSFVADDDVVQHIVRVGDKKRKGRKSTGSTPSQPKYCTDVTDNGDIAEESEEEVVRGVPSLLLEGEESTAGSGMFQFRTPKKSGQMAAKASEARTPKSILKATVSQGSLTPSSTSRSSKLQRKPETTTPYKLRKRNITDDDIDSDSSVSSSDDDSEDDAETNDTPAKRPPLNVKSIGNTPKSGRPRGRVEEEMPSMVESYFDIHSSSAVLTSDRTLARLGSAKMDREGLNRVLQQVPTDDNCESEKMYQEHRENFNTWMFQLCQGFNMLLYGLGSKRTLLEDFRKTHLLELSHLVVNGYFPSLTIKHILNAITYEILDYNGSFKGPLDQVRCIRTEMEQQGLQDFFLIVHNIDGTMLRGEKAQNILSLLSQIPGFHILASIDHINAPLLWDQSKCCRYNWLWYDVTTFMPYTDETSYENSLLVQQSGALALSSMTHVMKSLTSNAKSIFFLLAKHQLSHKDNSTYLGLSIQELYQQCREAFLVNSDLTLQAQLIEFRDHKLIKSKKSFDGIEHLMIPIDSVTLTEFIDQQEET